MKDKFNFFRAGYQSLTMVVLVLLIIVVLQSSISYTIAFGGLDNHISSIYFEQISVGWLSFRLILIVVTILLWITNRSRTLFRIIILTNAILTLGLLINMTALVNVLSGFSSQDIRTLLWDVVLLATSNILIFSVWYWIIDPPGIEETQREDEPWDFLFPQRMDALPHYENWMPRYTDYLYLAFTASFAFSPTDTMPLTRRAKMLMLLQALISIVTLTAIAGSAINILASTS